MVAVVSGCEGWQDIEDFGNEKLDWLRKFLPFTHGIPTRHSIARIVRGVKIEVLVDVLFAWVNTCRQASGQPIIAFDGKTVRGAVNRNGAHNGLHSVSAFDTGEGLVLCQKSTKNKGDEIATVRELLDSLDVTGAILTMDALHCQHKTLKKIEQQGADFVIQVKDNQTILHEAIRAQFQPHWDRNGEDLPQYGTQERGHGRQEERTVFQRTAELPDELKTKWPGVKTLIAVERSRSCKGKGSLDTHYYVSSRPVDPELAAKAVRQHWHIENQQH